MFRSIVFWLAAGVGVIFLTLLAIAVGVIRMVHNFITKED